MLVETPQRTSVDPGMLASALERWATEINKELEGRVTATPDHERPSAIPHMLKVVGSATKEQIAQIFRKN